MGLQSDLNSRKQGTEILFGERIWLHLSYLKKFGKVLPAAKALRFAQIETRLDLLVHLNLAANISSEKGFSLRPVGTEK
jgi:hypothetical protein